MAIRDRSHFGGRNPTGGYSAQNGGRNPTGGYSAQNGGRSFTKSYTNNNSYGGWYSGQSRQNSFNQRRQGNFSQDSLHGRRNPYNDQTRQRYGYGYRMSGFSKVMVSLGVAAGALIKGCGTLAKKSFNSAKDYTDSVKANRKEREENIYYTDEAEFDEVSFNQEEMLEILDIPANSLMCATETGVKLAKKCADALQE